MAGRPVVGLAPTQSATGRHIVGLAPTGGKQPAKKSGGGFLGGVGRFLKQGGSDLVNVAEHTPGGLIAIGKATAQDFYDTAVHPSDHTKKDRLLHIAQGSAQQVASDLKHPLRHPGFTALDLLPVANTAAKIGEAGRIAQAGGTAGEVGKALVTRPVYEARTLRRGGLEVKVGSSQSAMGAAGQRLYDKTLQKRATAKPGGVADKRLVKKMGKAITAEARTVQDVQKASGAALIAAGKKLSPAEQKALQVVAEEAPLAKRIHAASTRVNASSGKAVKRHQAELDLLNKAWQHLGEGPDGKPVFAGPQAEKLGKVLEHMRGVAGSREELLKSLGQLTDESVQGRKNAAARVAIGQPVKASEERKAPLAEVSPSAVRIPDVARRAPKSLGRPGGVGSAGTVGNLRALGSTSHEYTGALRENAVRRQDTTRLVGESSMEAARYAGLRHVHSLVRQAVTPEPTSVGDIAVRLDNLPSSKKLPHEVRAFLDNPDEFFRTATPKEAATAYEGVRSRLFIKPSELDAEAAADFNRLRAEGKIGWVPKQLLGELAKPHIPYTGKAIKTVDAINNASRFAILYLKPAYAIPNLLGNTALTILQQGFAAVANLKRAARLDHAMGPETAARIDAMMGEGMSRAISAHGQGLGSAVVDKAAGLWSKGVDIPFRRSSFLYEARRAGYTTPAQIHTLLTDPAHLQQLTDITQRANREMIDYANLSPTEREVVRRVVFFYPWIKGSTVYAGRLLREHPYKSAALGQLGVIGKQNDPVAPSYLAGVADVGGRLVNPNSAAIFNTPAQVGQALAGLAGGDVGQIGELSNFASPASALALALASHRNRQGYQYAPNENALSIALDQLVKGLPQYTLGQRISDASKGKGQDRLYPPNVKDALLQYLVGGIAPRKYNKEKLAELARTERSRYIP